MSLPNQIALNVSSICKKGIAHYLSKRCFRIIAISKAWAHWDEPHELLATLSKNGVLDRLVIGIERIDWPILVTLNILVAHLILATLPE